MAGNLCSITWHSCRPFFFLCSVVGFGYCGGDSFPLSTGRVSPSLPSVLVP